VKRLRAFGRRWWHQLTSMRTALLLLLALAIAAIPGSTFPQRSINPTQVADYYTANPELAPVLDRLWVFDVYTSPWFSAIYLLLMVSLVGCILPRTRTHLRALRAAPPDAPSKMDILPYHRRLDVPANETLARATLLQRRFRTAEHRRDDGTVTLAAEKGHLRETGNLLFHVSMIVVLVGISVGSLFSWYGNRILSEGADYGFCNNLQQYDEYGLGAYVDETALPRFCLQLDAFEARFENGQPVWYQGDLTYTLGEETGSYELRVNHPLSIGGANVYLIGHGYTPVVTFTDRYGNADTRRQPFLATDGALNSEGAFKFPDANFDPETGRVDTGSEVGFDAVLVPTYDDATPMLIGSEPELNNPVLALSAYIGDLGLSDGRPESVYSVNPDQIESGALEAVNDTVEVIGLGDTWELPDGSSLAFDGVEQYAVLTVRHDPGRGIVLGGAILLLGGLMPALTVRRRRYWIRWNPDGTVEVGGLNRNDYDGLAEECDEITRDLAPASVDEDAEPEKHPEGSPA
jgi:cytochrome c biogenesis protein